MYIIQVTHNFGIFKTSSYKIFTELTQNHTKKEENYMPKWTYKILINNNLDRALELVTASVPWGKCEKNFPKIIKAGEVGEFSVYSPAGVPSGIEFYFSMRDKVNKEGEPSYGSFSFSVDIPYWQHKNKSSFECYGILTQTGFQKIPDGNHDFSTMATINSSLCENSLPQENLMGENVVQANYGMCYDWDSVQKLEVVDPDDKTIDDFVPEKNIFSSRKPVNRTEKISIPKKFWKQIIDKQYPDDYSKKNFVKDYFTVSVYEIRKNVTVSIAANQSYEKTLEISNRSTVRRETRQEFQIENTINGNITGEKFSLSETLRMQYQISHLDEYCDENMKSVSEVFSYHAVEQDRDVVLWDLAEILMLYRVNRNNKIELVGVGDYFVMSTQKTYVRSHAQENAIDFNATPSEDLLCASSENNFCLDDLTIQEMYEAGYGAPLRASGVVQGNITINGKNYRWMELRQGTNRGMLFNPERHCYVFSPNPHRDPWYNKHQQQWYTEMAREFQRVGNGNNWNANNWDNGQPINNLRVHGISYTAK